MRQPQKADPIRQIAATELPTRWGLFRALGFERWPTSQRSPETALVLVLGDPSIQAPLVRIHSQCITVKVLAILRCDCGEQPPELQWKRSPRKDAVLRSGNNRRAVIGLTAKLRPCPQDEGLDIDRKPRVWLKADQQILLAAILNHLGIREIRLLSNNPISARNG